MPMYKRYSIVDSVEANIVSFASVFEIGDSNRILPRANVLAVQREKELFFGNEGNFAQFSVFNEPIPLPPITEKVTMLKNDLNPVIHVRNINILGVSTSSVFHIGSTCFISSEARIKHIRHLLSE
jgi:spore germination protein PE